MAEINGGALKYTAEMDIAGLKKALKDGERGMKGLSQIAKEMGADLDNVFDVTSENIKIQKEVIIDLEKEYKKLQDTIEKMAPGKAKLSLMGDAAQIATEIEAEKKALADLEGLVQSNSTKHESLRQKLTQVKNEMAQLAAAGQQNSERYTELADLAREYQEALDEVNNTMNAVGGNTALNAIVETMNIASSGMAIYQGVTALAGAENERLERIMVNLQATMSIAIGVQQLQNSLQRESAIIQAIVALQAKARARAEALATSTTIGATIAQRAFNLVANANPYVLLATAILTVVGALVLFTDKNKKAREEQDQINKAIADGAAEQIIAYKKLQEEYNRLGNTLQEKQRFIEENKDAFDSLGVSVENVTEAERFFKDGSADFIKSLMLRAEAAANAQLAIEKYKESIESDQKVSQFNEDWKKSGFFGKIGLSARAIFGNLDDKEAEEQRKKAGDLIKKEADLIEEADKLRDKAAKSKPAPPTVYSEEWYRGEISRLQSLKSKAKVGSAEWEKYRKEIERLDDLLNPKDPKKKKPKKERELAEIFDASSVAKLQQQLSLIDNALQRSSKNGDVALRAIDKYGKEYTTKQIVSLEEAKQMRLDKAQELAEAEKRIQVKSIKDQVDESNTLWEQYYSTVESLGKDTADRIFKDLLQNNSNQFDALSKIQSDLIEKSKTGNLSSQENEVLQTVNEAIDGMLGKQSALDKFRSTIEQTMSGMSSEAERLLFIQDLLSKGASEDKSTGKTAYLTETERQLQLSLKNQYQSFINEHRKFEEQKTAITAKYNNIRKEIENSSVDPAEKTRRLAVADKDQSKEISAIALAMFQKTDLWVKAFGDLSRIGPQTLKKLREQFKALLDSDQAKALKIEDLKALQDQYTKINDMLSGSDPFSAITISIDRYKEKRKELGEVEKKYGKESPQYLEKLEETNLAFAEIIEVSGAAAKTMVGFATQMTDAFGGMSEEMKQTINDIMQLVDGITNAVAGYFSGNYGQMLSGIVQIFTSMAKMLSGDNKREKQIREQQRAIQDLKTAYQDLQYQIEKTAGEEQIKGTAILIENLKQQQAILIEMRKKEADKKKSDKDKMNSYDQQIQDINRQISELMDNFQKNITTTDFKDLSQKMAEALKEAFLQGEDAAKSFDKVVDDVMRNAVENALRIKILEPAAKDMIEKLYSSMGFGNTGNENIKNQIADIEAKLIQIQKDYDSAPAFLQIEIANQKKLLEQQLAALKSQLLNANSDGGFDGLTEKEREDLKDMGEKAMQDYIKALEQYRELFNQSSENAQGLKGDIRGITEKTAGALEAQINAMRIIQVKQYQENQSIFRNSLDNLVKIEFNTRRLHNIDRNIQELNSKIKYGAAGII